MLNKLLLASLISAACSVPTATADRGAPSPAPREMVPHHALCVSNELSNHLLFEIDHKSDVVKNYVFTSLAIGRNGSWRYTATQNGKVIHRKSGCLDLREAGNLRTALASATWKTSLADVRCMAHASDFTQYSYQGKPVLTSRMCDGVILDEPTRKALAEANAIATELMPRR